MTAALPISPLACWLIDLYQRYISPRKGFCCAYRLRHRRRDSCSQFAKRAIGKLGLLPGVRLLGRRFDKCERAARAQRDGSRRREKGRWKDHCWSAANYGCDSRRQLDGCDVASFACNLWP